MASIKFTQLFIDNTFVDAQAKKKFATFNPATGETIALVHEGLKEDVDLAVEAAKRAFDRDSEWRRMDASKRGLLLLKFAELMERDLEQLAALESLNNGKPLSSARGDIEFSIEAIRFYAGAADKLNGQTIPADGNKLVYTLHEPVGVCAAITPWNYPIMMTAIKVAPCLAAGNTLVLKPAEQTPLTALAIADLIREAGFPPGVLNVVPGFGPTAGQPLVEHPHISKVTFTGSTEVGKLIQRVASGTLKRVSLELGGKSPLIIFPDADLDKAVKTAHNMVMVNQGQCCVAATRTFVHQDIYDEFVRKSVELAKARKIADPFDPDCEHGPQIDQEQLDKVLELIESGKREGAKLECGGQRVGSTGYFVQPTVFSNVTDDMRIAREEIFGPVQQIIKFSEVDEVIARANSTNYGLGAGLFTKDLDIAMKVSSRIQSGQVYVNNYFNFAVQIPFGGFKESGIGREFGLDGLRQYYEIKTVVIDLPFKI